MHSLKEIQLKCNKKLFINFDGGELSSDGGLLMIREFLHTLGIEKLLKDNFKTNDPALFPIHKDDENLLQMIYQIFGTYYEDNCADELHHDPVLSAVLGKEALRFKKDGTTHLKLEALPVLMDVTKITKITGDYNDVLPYLLVDKVMGGVNFCLGLSREGSVYVPSSTLLEDIRKLTEAPSQVLVIMEKNTATDIYSIVKHVAKGLNLNTIKLPEEISGIIQLDHYMHKGK